MTLFSYSSSCNPYLIQKILFELKLLSQGSIEQDHLPKNVKTIGFDKKINFSNESVKITTIYDLLFTIAIYSLQNVNKHSSKMKISTKIVSSEQAQFFPVWSLFCVQAKNMIYCQVFQKIISGTRPSVKKVKVGKWQSNRVIF